MNRQLLSLSFLFLFIRHLHASQTQAHKEHDALIFASRQEIYSHKMGLIVRKDPTKSFFCPMTDVGYYNKGYREGYQTLKNQLFVPFIKEFSLVKSLCLDDKGYPVILQTITGTGTGLLYHHPEDEEISKQLDNQPFCALTSEQSNQCQALIQKNIMPYFAIGKNQYFIVENISTCETSPLNTETLVWAADISAPKFITKIPKNIAYKTANLHFLNESDDDLTTGKIKLKNIEYAPIDLVFENYSHHAQPIQLCKNTENDEYIIYFPLERPFFAYALSPEDAKKLLSHKDRGNRCFFIKNYLCCFSEDPIFCQFSEKKVSPKLASEETKASHALASEKPYKSASFLNHFGMALCLPIAILCIYKLIQNQLFSAN